MNRDLFGSGSQAGHGGQHSTVSPFLRKVRKEGTCGLGCRTLHRNRVGSLFFWENGSWAS